MVTAKVKKFRTKDRERNSNYFLQNKTSCLKKEQRTSSLDGFQNVVENVFIILLSYVIIEGFL